MSPELELFIQEEVESGRFPNRDAFLMHAVRLVQLEREDAMRGIQLGLVEAEAGLGIPVDEAFRSIRSKFNIADER